MKDRLTAHTPSDLSDLRASLKAKLDDRRRLISEAFSLRQQKQRAERDLDTVQRITANPLARIELDYMADEIIQEIVRAAIEASSVVARETVDTGDYEIGIDVPSLHIRRRMARFHLRDYRGSGEELLGDLPMRRVSVDLKATFGGEQP